VFDEINPSGPEQVGIKRMRLRYSGTCRVCRTDLPAHTDAFYDRSTRTVRCVSCPAPGEAMPDRPERSTPAGPQHVRPAGPGTAGSSARREYELRKAKDEQRLRERWGRLGHLAVMLSNERQSTTAWQRGAVGEERLGARLDVLVGENIAVLHDRRIPGTRANIDHLVITPTRIWVIDAKRYKGRPTLKVEGGVLRPRTERLLVGRRDCTDLVEGAIRQVNLVQEVATDVAVTGVLCFVEADWPLVGAAIISRGIHIVWPKRLVGMLTETHGGSVDVPAFRDLLASRFLPATPR
jgi:hypothetical protein